MKRIIACLMAVCFFASALGGCAPSESEPLVESEPPAESEPPYEIVYNGGMNWAVPWLAGFYALCCQAEPEITPAEFVEEITSTTQTVSLPYGAQANIIDPAAVIARLTG